MKRCLLLLLVTTLLLSAVACQPGTLAPMPTTSAPENQPTSSPGPESGERTGLDYQAMTQEEILSLYPKQEADGLVVVGSTQEMEQDFYRGWSSLSTNQSIQSLLEGYATVTYTKDGYFIFDPVVVRDHRASIDDAGNKTYTFHLQENLLWSDGTPITAQDYVASILLEASAAMASLDGFTSTLGDVYTGYQEYHNGSSRFFPGVRYLSQYSFSVTISASTLPYFYDYSYVAVRPIPLHVLLPDVVVQDDGTGAYLSREMTKDRLKEIFLGDNKDGYRYIPTTVCGPYQFGTYDKETHSVLLMANELYLGSYDGIRPTIKTILWKQLSADALFAAVEDGSVDLAIGLSGKTALEAGLALAESSGVQAIPYYRSGYSKLAVVCDVGPTQFKEVRQALAHCINREALLQEANGNFGTIVNGYYGPTDLHYLQNKEQLDALQNSYPYDLEKAKALLIAGGWTKNAAGLDFVEGVDLVRYKEVVGEDGIPQLMRLSIHWMSSATGKDTPLLRKFLLEGDSGAAIRNLGIEILETSANVTDLQNYYYHKDGFTKRYHLFSVGVNFPAISSAQYYYNPLYLNTSYNTNRLGGEDGERLYTLAKALAQTDPGFYEEYWSKWVAFQQCWNDLLPDIPLYAEGYMDLATSKLSNYKRDALWDASQALLRASLTES